MKDYKVIYKYSDRDNIYSYEIMANNSADVLFNLKTNANPKYVDLINVLEISEVSK